MKNEWMLNFVNFDRMLLVLLIGVQGIVLARVVNLERSYGEFIRSQVQAQPAQGGGDRDYEVTAVPSAVEPEGAVRADVGLTPRRFFPRPADEFSSIREADRFFQSAFEDMARFQRFVDSMDRGWDRMVTSPTMDMKDGGADFIVVFTLPDIDPAGLEVNLNGRLLSLTYSFEDANVQGGRRTSFERKVLMPGPVGDLSQAQAYYTNGMLRVRVPKGPPGAMIPDIFRLF